MEERERYSTETGTHLERASKHYREGQKRRGERESERERLKQLIWRGKLPKSGYKRTELKIGLSDEACALSAKLKTNKMSKK